MCVYFKNIIYKLNFIHIHLSSIFDDKRHSILCTITRQNNNCATITRRAIVILFTTLIKKIKEHIVSISVKISSKPSLIKSCVYGRWKSCDVGAPTTSSKHCTQLTIVRLIVSPIKCNLIGHTASHHCCTIPHF